ncbi:GQ67_03472T0 [Komagataella phaffii]|nr:GQ67_03472T0 [Komagataella phaffii]AOA69371.1 GQ68_03442T0 [Komagataella phaffii GS115]
MGGRHFDRYSCISIQADTVIPAHGLTAIDSVKHFLIDEVDHVQFSGCAQYGTICALFNEHVIFKSLTPDIMSDGASLTAASLVLIIREHRIALLTFIALIGAKSKSISLVHQAWQATFNKNCVDSIR